MWEWEDGEFEAQTLDDLADCVVIWVKNKVDLG
jgi:hypothetical protein